MRSWKPFTITLPVMAGTAKITGSTEVCLTAPGMASRAKMRIAVKKILQRHGYPPDMTADAVKTVLKQAEALAAAMS